MWWEQLAGYYTAYIGQKELNPSQRKSAFSVICKLGLGASAEDLAGDLANLPTHALDEILAMMR